MKNIVLIADYYIYPYSCCRYLSIIKIFATFVLNMFLAIMKAFHKILSDLYKYNIANRLIKVKIRPYPSKCSLNEIRR